jgi:protoporphyrinogen oxidase
VVSMKEKVLVLGGGMTGLGAGLSGLPVYEAEESPGGICSSYYVRSGDSQRLHTRPTDGKAYRFELGGGHWIFGGDPLVLKLISSLVPVKKYARRSAIWLSREGLLVPYPIQNHLRYLGPHRAAVCLREILEAAMTRRSSSTMAEWLRHSFGPTLYELFFGPFHKLYTAGLFEKIAPQDPHKSPFDINLVVEGAFRETKAVGYNTTFVYPVDGLNTLAERMAAQGSIRYGKRAVRVDPDAKEVEFADGTLAHYEVLLSTLPLNRMVAMTGLKTIAPPDPSPSVLVVNIGAQRGPNCPDEHWVYVPHSRAGFHRVGFYSNVDASFLPVGARAEELVSIYVEKAFGEDEKPSRQEISAFCQMVVEELKEWGWIGPVDVIDPTWIDVAYTWSWVGSHWRSEALAALESKGIYQVGRYARWVFQGIADSIRDGLLAGVAMRACSQVSSLENGAQLVGKFTSSDGTDKRDAMD